MALHPRREPFTAPSVADEGGLYWPFGHFDGIDSDEIRETAYEVFFTACRSSPGFGGRNAISFYSNHRDGDGGGGGRPGGGAVVVMTPTSRIKRALRLKMLKRSPSRRMSMAGGGGEGGGGGGSGSGSGGSAPGSPSLLPHYGSGGNSPAGIGFNTVPMPARQRRPLTSAEIMRIQMRVTEQSDSRLRKTLVRTLVGQPKSKEPAANLQEKKCKKSGRSM